MAHDIWNPWHGCHKCSIGCQNCYMYCLDKWRNVSETSSVVKRTNNFNYPLACNRKKEYKIQSGERIRVNMTSDTFIEEADEWRDEMWSIIKMRSDVKFWLLTKRPERIFDHLPADWGDGYSNVSLNITCENQEMFDKRWPIFSSIPAKHKGLCIAPILGYIDITRALASKQLDEVLCGGENYDNPRYVDFKWVEYLSQQCVAYVTNFCWYETGTKLYKEGKMYNIPQKSMQAAQAYLSGLNHKYYDVKWDLYDHTGRLLESAELYQPLYNLNHCMFCANRMVCNGCSSCGNCCGEIELGTLDRLHLAEDLYIERYGVSKI